MKAAPELAVSSQFDVYPLIKAKLYQVEWLFHSGVLIGHGPQQAMAAFSLIKIA